MDCCGGGGVRDGCSAADETSLTRLVGAERLSLGSSSLSRDLMFDLRAGSCGRAGATT